MHRNFRKHMACFKATFVLETYMLVIFINNSASKQNMNSAMIIRGITRIKAGEFFFF